MSASFAEERESRADPVGVLLHLVRRVRHATSNVELNFIAVNETHALTPYRQAAVWFAPTGVTTLSGVVTPEANAPFVLWLDRIAVQLGARAEQAPFLIAPNLFVDADAREWDEWLPAQAVWLPLAIDEKNIGGLLLARDEPWREGELALLAEWLDVLLYAYRAQQRPASATRLLRWLQKPRIGAKISWRERIRGFVRSLREPATRRETLNKVFHWLRKQPLQLWREPIKRYSVLAFLCAFIPVKLSVLVPGELAPAQPAAIRAPMDGIVDRFFVTPNQSVKQGDLLLQLDLSALTSKLEVARQELATSEAEYRQAAQQAVFDARSKSQLALLQGRIAEHQTEVEYLQSQRTRAQIVAPLDGVVLMDDPTEWIGRPVTVGERVLTIADAYDVEVEAWLTPADAIDLPDGAAVTLYLDAAPLRPVHASVRYVAHEAIARPDGSYAYRLRAVIDAKETKPRVGAKGTARVAGHYVPLIYWTARRPIAAIRPWIGW